jgi:hypothetical protein
MMVTPTAINLETAAARLLDVVMEQSSVTLDLGSATDGAAGIERLLLVLNAEARRRGIGVEVAEQEGGQLCLSLHRP